MWSLTCSHIQKPHITRAVTVTHTPSHSHKGCPEGTSITPGGNEAYRTRSSLQVTDRNCPIGFIVISSCFSKFCNSETADRIQPIIVFHSSHFKVKTHSRVVMSSMREEECPLEVAGWKTWMGSSRRNKTFFMPWVKWPDIQTQLK